MHLFKTPLTCNWIPLQALVLLGRSCPVTCLHCDTCLSDLSDWAKALISCAVYSSQFDKDKDRGLSCSSLCTATCNSVKLRLVLLVFQQPPFGLIRNIPLSAPAYKAVFFVPINSTRHFFSCKMSCTEPLLVLKSVIFLNFLVGPPQPFILLELTLCCFMTT